MSQCVWHYSWSKARNLQEFIDSTTGVVLEPKVQPGPHQVDWCFCPFLPPQPKPDPYSTARYAGAMGIKWLAQGHNSKAQARIWTPTLGLVAQDPNNCTKYTHTHTHTHTHDVMHTCTRMHSTCMHTPYMHALPHLLSVKMASPALDHDLIDGLGASRWRRKAIARVNFFKGLHARYC